MSSFSSSQTSRLSPTLLSPLARFAASDGVCASALSLTSGFADAIGYLQAGIFAANMTGNTVLAGISLAEGNWVRAAGQASAIVAFFAGAVAGRLLRRMADDGPWLPLLAEAILLGIAGFHLDQHAVVIALIAAAMGMQATAIPKFGGAAVSTVVITSTLARLAELAVDRAAVVLRVSGPRAGGMPGGLLLATWLCYGIGAGLASVLMPLLASPLLAAAALVALFSLLTGLAGTQRRPS